MLKFSITVHVLFFIAFTEAEIEKRQVGVLARSGALPNLGGKRSVGALARNGQLPGKRISWGNEEHERLRILSNWLREMDSTIQAEQAREHEASKRNMEAMARAGYLVKPATESPEPRSLLDSEEFLGNEQAENGGLIEEKRGGLASLARHGYIGKRADEDYEEEIAFTPAEKRHLAAIKSLISRHDKRHLGAFRQFSQGKRNVGAARNFASLNNFEDKRNLGSARRFMGKRNLGAARNFILNDKKNVGAARQFFTSGNKKNLGSARNFYHGKRNLASLARDGDFPNMKQSDDYPWDNDDEFNFDDFHDEEKRNIASYVRQQGKRYLGSLRAGKRVGDDDELAPVLTDPTYDGIHEFLGNNEDDSSAIAKREIKNGEAGQGQVHLGASRRKRSLEYAFSPNEMEELEDYNDYDDTMFPNSYDKRFLGRIPQLGRAPQQKIQPPPGRRRPQLRPNWL